ncbi:Rieske (2Fe-2S) protein [Natrarchaeobaculum aegyptiacum]|uniref:(2Fe-2S)-binding protein n=1 Tax=Natrarchaeobaculum aegyptiacum TaxID=745377 RepID=A0A2Z2HNV6_9EURY|nr:Rieske 2Fe-2S domain-containing protein [Natrarchaeobaculum aegyptiacum]ARS88649.1 (2Fe-2S)-binding protein [Natrarchaeobaculum aegyptiacum]
MSDRYRLTTVERVREAGSWLFTIRDRYDAREEAILVPCDAGVGAWVNRCTHQPQRLDTGRGATIRDGEIVCPRHGSTFDACSGACDHGEAAGTRLRPIEVTVDDGVVYLTDDDVQYLSDGGLSAGNDGDDGDDDDGDSESDDDGGPSSTSHISF